MTRTLALALALILGTTACEPPPEHKPTPTKPTKLQEDDPGWNCTTMGDKKCGPNWGKD